MSKKKAVGVYDSENNLVGRVVDIFGPVNEPYLAISAKKGMRITRIIGREIYKR